MSIELPDLPYAFDALEPVISRRTLETHHGKHHRGYIDKVNALVRNTDLAGHTLEAIVRQSAQRAPADPAMKAVFNNAAQAWNHAFYWNSLCSKGGRGPQGVLLARIGAEFGDARGFVEAFKAAATGYFGSGWAWLILDGGTVRIATTSNADTPIVHEQVPPLVIDVWEHAYYLDHQERRAAYVAGVMDNLLNWEFAERNLNRTGDFLGDTIDVAGHLMDAAEIERALVGHPAVAEAAVVGYPHPAKGQGIYAYITLASGARPGEELRHELEQWVRTEIDPVAVPDVLQWASALPKNRIGQLARCILRKIAADDSCAFGDISVLADATVIDDLRDGHERTAAGIK